MNMHETKTLHKYIVYYNIKHTQFILHINSKKMSIKTNHFTGSQASLQLTGVNCILHSQLQQRYILPQLASDYCRMCRKSLLNYTEIKNIR